MTGRADRRRGAFSRMYRTTLRVTYGAGIERCCDLILHAADVHGLLPNRPEDRRVRIDWPDPFPESRLQQLELAERKLRLGVPKRQVLTELGYAESTMPANDPELPPPPA